MVPIQSDILLIDVLYKGLNLFFIILIHKENLGCIFGLMIGNIRVLLHQHFFDFAFRYEIELKSGALTKFARGFD